MKMSTAQVREKFTQFFQNRSHQVVPSAPVVPHEDPTLLFVNAGMNQFKDVFLGKADRGYSTAVSVQKCLRVGGKHNDLENVGHTARHLTFFEMLGNFSFGDYSKKEAIAFSWELATQVLGMDKERIWPTVFLDDDEAYELWKQFVPQERITRLGEKDNFWSMGEVGPCGPCSELLYDRGPAFGSATSPAEDPEGERFVEFWNLVFMQYEKDIHGQMKLLPKPCVDTGAGLERLMMILQETPSVFETDVLGALIASLEKLSGVAYESEGKPAFRVVADHLRCLCFAIADGVVPSNTDRGYVLRKVLRRAVRYGRQLGFDKPFLGQLVPVLIEQMGESYPELQQGSKHMVEIITREEEAFFTTLRHGGAILSRVIEQTKNKKISGDDAFLLKDTYGLPFEEIELIAVDYGLTVDRERFVELEAEAKERSRAGRKAAHQKVESSLFEDMVSTIFVNEHEAFATVVACVKDGELVDELQAGEQGGVILDQTPFYAEGGGQVGDSGAIGSEQVEFSVRDTKRPYPGIFLHVGAVATGSVAVGDKVKAQIDRSRRKKIEANHTATHILHRVLFEVLGEHVRQSGSLVNDEHLRFDFCHHEALTDEQVIEIERRVNATVRANIEVDFYELALEEVQKRQDIRQIFGEKYGSSVRVLEVGESKELCGGTHVKRTGDIGYFRLARQMSIAAGIRRVEAFTGEAAENYSREAQRYIEQLAEVAKTAPNKLLERLVKWVEETKELERQLLALKSEKIALLTERLNVESSVVWGELGLSAKELKIAVEQITGIHPDKIVVLGAVEAQRAHLVVRTPKGSEHNAGDMLKQGLSLLDGRGGGGAEFAQGAGPRFELLHEALKTVVGGI